MRDNETKNDEVQSTEPETEILTSENTGEEATEPAPDVEQKSKYDLLTEDSYDPEKVDKEEGIEKLQKATGIMAIILAVMGLVAVGICIYFMILSPTYIKEGESDKLLNYAEIATSTDIDMSVMHERLTDIGVSPQEPEEAESESLQDETIPADEGGLTDE